MPAEESKGCHQLPSLRAMGRNKRQAAGRQLVCYSKHACCGIDSATQDHAAAARACRTNQRPRNSPSQLGSSGRPASTHLRFSSFSACAPVLRPHTPLLLTQTSIFVAEPFCYYLPYANLVALPSLTTQQRRPTARKKHQGTTDAGRETGGALLL